MPNRRYTASHKIKARYDATTLAQQTLGCPFLKLQVMEVEQQRKESSKEMIEINIKEFMETAHRYLFGLMPVRHQPALVLVPIRRSR
ncbi:MAG TPA: hypothetical protein VLA64_04475 [Azonexus sp.]|nr:hypothetical protein [Azonexus sp.]